jgi:hypothetical protein
VRVGPIGRVLADFTAEFAEGAERIRTRSGSAGHHAPAYRDSESRQRLSAALQSSPSQRWPFRNDDFGEPCMSTLSSEVAALIGRFPRNRYAYHSPGYNGGRI